MVSWFFFFKQKTAYEMRISDWSSDVCSSDLWTTGKVGKHALRAILDDPRLELAACYAWSEDKEGQDAGDLCGRPNTGIAATNQIADLIALGDRKSVVSGKSVSVRVDLGVRRIIKHKITDTH